MSLQSTNPSVPQGFSSAESEAFLTPVLNAFLKLIGGVGIPLVLWAYSLRFVSVDAISDLGMV